ncbi:MAG TPA: hypothetical protein VMW03_07000 [Candidatus Krumholzibacteriaceae bacterium]|nr:hypothetical protein [Candidatus Krumholzibacteriaceae bacterium]
MTTVKTTIDIDEEVWEGFKRTVARRYGGTLSAGQVIEEIIRGYVVAEFLRESSGILGVDVDEYPSSSEVERNRPSVQGSSADAVRNMRDERADRFQ